MRVNFRWYNYLSKKLSRKERNTHFNTPRASIFLKFNIPHYLQVDF